jgi:hypothetical protein
MKENRPPFLFDDKLKTSIKKVKKVIEKEEKLQDAFVKASILGAFDQDVNNIIYKIRTMGKLSENELSDIRLWLNMSFTPRFKDNSNEVEERVNATLEDISNTDSI